jgi:predicted methyltransferase
VVAAADRTEVDRALDAGRKPAELLSFCGVRPGMKVADLAAGRGYTTELLARMVGDKGTVYGQNTKFILGFAEQEWSERLTKPVMKNVVRVDTEFDEPLPANVKDLDLVTLVLFYHDTVWMKTDRPRMNKNIFGALKSGGIFAVVDHSSKPGDGLNVTQSLHRIEESVVKAEIEQAGFVLDAESDFLRVPEDARDWSASPRTAGERRGHSDRFVLRFKKP